MAASTGARTGAGMRDVAEGLCRAFTTVPRTRVPPDTAEPRTRFALGVRFAASSLSGSSCLVALPVAYRRLLPHRVLG